MPEIPQFFSFYSLFAQFLVKVSILSKMFSVIFKPFLKYLGYFSSVRTQLELEPFEPPCPCTCCACMRCYHVSSSSYLSSLHRSITIHLSLCHLTNHRQQTAYKADQIDFLRTFLYHTVFIETNSSWEAMQLYMKITLRWQ